MKKQKPRSLRPFQKFIKTEAASGVLLFISVILALVWINLSEITYDKVFHAEFAIVLSDFHLGYEISHWINDFLMAVFFLLIGLEIKREILIGELSNLRKALLPIIAAFGGMIIPPMFYLLVNLNNPEGFDGWAIPMATDIAFALGILFLLGNRVPTSLRVFLATLAIVDDIGAVIVIAIFYTSNIEITYAAATLVIGLILVAFNLYGVRKIEVYALVGLFLWYFMFQSGIHATLSGIILAGVIPATTTIDYKEFKILSNGLVVKLNESIKDDEELSGIHLKLYQNTIMTLEKACQDVEAPLQRLEHSLTPLVSFIIMPVFAISNAGIILSSDIGKVFLDPITFGIILGLVFGKALGITMFVYISTKLKVTDLPFQLNWFHIIGVGFLGGIGFTMSIFISGLALADPDLITTAKLGILVSSILSGTIGSVILINANKLEAYFKKIKG